MDDWSQYLPLWQANLPWRIGRKLGRTIYVQLGAEPAEDDPLVGMVETKPLAQYIVALHNRSLTLR